MIKKRVLILTTSPGFGGLINQVLEDTGAYLPMVVTEPVEALELADRDAVALVVMDADFAAKVSAEYTDQIRQLAPQARLVIIPSEEAPDDARLSQFEPDVILPSPFYLPDLISAIEEFFGPLVDKDENRKVYGDRGPRITRPEKEAVAAPDWLQDVDKAAGYLTRLSLESASMAALIVRGDQVWAYAGELPKEAALELAEAVADHTSHGDGADLARFVHLTSTKGDYMLYGTSLGGDFTLALAFDAQVPFSQMRAQVNELARKLARAPQELVNQDRTAATAYAEKGSGSETPPEKSEPLPSKPSNAGNEAPVASRSATQTASPVGEPGELQYTFALLPRLPKHVLTGDLGNQLADWLPELCIAYAWRLDNMIVEPELVYWTLTLPADTPPEKVVQTMDKHLSERIFEEFPRLAKENPSGQFWAPLYLIINDGAPSRDQLDEFIRRTRKRQGIKA